MNLFMEKSLSIGLVNRYLAIVSVAIQVTATYASGFRLSGSFPFPSNPQAEFLQ